LILLKEKQNLNLKEKSGWLGLDPRTDLIPLLIECQRMRGVFNLFGIKGKTLPKVQVYDTFNVKMDGQGVFTVKTSNGSTCVEVWVADIEQAIVFEGMLQLGFKGDGVVYYFRINSSLYKNFIDLVDQVKVRREGR